MKNDYNGTSYVVLELELGRGRKARHVHYKSECRKKKGEGCEPTMQTNYKARARTKVFRPFLAHRLSRRALSYSRAPRRAALHRVALPSFIVSCRVPTYLSLSLPLVAHHHLNIS